MTLEFDPAGLGAPDGLDAVEFGVGRVLDTGELFSIVPIDTAVQAALATMALETWRRMQEQEFGGGGVYDPADKQESSEYLVVAAGDPAAARFMDLHVATLETDASALNEARSIDLYFARFRSGDGRMLTGVRKAAQFKGVLKSRGRLIRQIDDSMRLVDEDLFRLDEDFDVLIDRGSVHILHPKSFEALGHLQQLILDAVEANARDVSRHLPYVDFGPIEAYARTHPRAARLLASIRAQGGTDGVDRRRLVHWCRLTGVAVRSTTRGVEVPPESILGFLEVLDRRRYELELVPGSAERYRATGRSRVVD